ncbi:hypothetical protein [Nostoc punctiforme]|uniref:hypothetical protein n=1 Tax=Nostoc punctiforme TaxID=272131 RepID=UPI000045BF12|nr:hypothetical protein [Nostoc punctiforme]
MLNQRVLAGLLAVSTVMTTLAVNASPSSAAIRIDVSPSYTATKFTKKMTLAKRPPNILEWNRKYRKFCATVTKAPICKR